MTPTPHPTEPPHVTATPRPTPAFAVQPLNISTRLRIEAGDNVAIGGFMITGNTPKMVAIRGIGPSLQSAGFPTDALSDPVLELRGSDNSLIATNDNWRDNSDSATELQILGLAPQFESESAILIILPPAIYTASVSGKNGGTGIGLVEVYDLDATNGSQLTNISTRGLVGNDDHVVIGGFILSGTGDTRVLLRAIGPSLGSAGITNCLPNPVLELRDSNGVLLQSNDNWRDSQEASIGATGLQPLNDLEPAILATLPPDSYTTVLTGKDRSTGVALVEIYNLSESN